MAFPREFSSELINKKIGVWGYGIVGKSAVNYIKNKPCSLSICEQKLPPSEELNQLQQNHILWYPQKELITFLEENDYIIPSPGIDLRPYSKYAHKWLSELDLFTTAWHKPIIAITGTVGKTTITAILDTLFKKAEIPIATGGNIGTGMLSLVAHQNDVHYALLELSSWQLMQNKHCAPHVALWTNFSENHLDRHNTMEAYFDAKYQIIAHQSAYDYAIAPIDLMHKMYVRNPKSNCIFFCVEKPPLAILKALRPQDRIVYFDQNGLHSSALCDTQLIMENISCPTYSFIDNWIAICTVLHLLKLPIDLINSVNSSQYAQPHRLAYIGTFDGAIFYNDSKSTTPISTLASVKKFPNQSIHLFLGGLSKGADRTPLISTLQKNIVSVYCFGAEAHELKKLCDQYHVPSLAFEKLEPAFLACIQKCQPEHVILFSPAGSSYDLFEHFADRGKQFEKMVLAYYKKEK